MIKERLNNFADTAKRVAQDPEFQARARRAARAIGDTALGGALGEDGLDLVKTDRQGNRRVSKFKAARVTARALRNPIGVAQKAARGVAKEARSTARSRALETARGIIGSGQSEETYPEDGMFDSLPGFDEPTTPDTTSDLVGIDWDALDGAEPMIVEPSRGGRIARGLDRLRRGHDTSPDANPDPFEIPDPFAANDDGLPPLPSPDSYGGKNDHDNLPPLPPLPKAPDY
ncbi:MAG TPA: hypothetical protein VGF75_07910 [Candidatus Saccharimonadales bacterium]|jgi:hypothetical protein